MRRGEGRTWQQTCPTHAASGAVTSVQAREVGDTALALLRSYNRRTLDVIGSRLYFYTSWAYECSGNLEALRGCVRACVCKGWGYHLG